MQDAASRDPALPYVGFIGLGDQGGPMAEQLVADGYPLGIWARRQDVAERYAAIGASVHESPAALGARADFLCLCVTGDADVRQILLEQGALAAMRTGTHLVMHSTIDPAQCRQLARACTENGVAFVEAPVSGSGWRARERSLLVLTAGDGRRSSDLSNIFSAYAGTVIDIGDAGAAMTAKLVNNLMAAVHISIAYRGLELGQTAGIDPAILRKALLAGTGRSFAVDLLERVHEPGRAAHIASIMDKDVALAIDALPLDNLQGWRDLAVDGLAVLHRLARGESSLNLSGDER